MSRDTKACSSYSRRCVSLEHQAKAERKRRGLPYSWRESAKAAGSRDSAAPDARRIGEWLREQSPRVPRDADALWALVDLWGEWSGQTQKRSYWNRLVADAQPIRSIDNETDKQSVGRPIDDWTDPIDLEIHPAIDVNPHSPDLPTYIQRKHDLQLQEVIKNAVEGQSSAIFLIGGSSTGKSRACWEAVQLLPKDWLLWHPISPSNSVALANALEGRTIGPRTVLWLNEAQLYFGATSEGLGEYIAAELRELLRSPNRGPILILGTMWQQHWNLLTRRPKLGELDNNPQTRTLLRGRNVVVPEEFSDEDLTLLGTEARKDARLKLAVKYSPRKITQFLAGAFDLVDRFESAPPEATAVMAAAMDACRLGHNDKLSASLLRCAAVGYIDDITWDSFDDYWFEDALAYITRPCRGVNGPLARVRPRIGSPKSGETTYRLADFLGKQPTFPVVT